jgi:hypothetical protein
MNNNDLEVSASSDPGQSAFLQKRDGFQLYNNTEYGFSIVYPQNWAPIEGDSKPGDFVTDIVTFEPLDKKGKHFTKKFACGEVCLQISTDYAMFGENTLAQYSDALYNGLKDQKAHEETIEYNSLFKLDGKKAFEMIFESEQGNRDYVHKFVGTTYPPDSDVSKTFFSVQSKTRDKYAGEMIPLFNTMIDSFRFTENKK